MSSLLERVVRALEPLVDQPIAQRLLTEASAARDRTLRLQEATLGALNLPTASDLARLERRLRSLTDGLERVEDHLDRVDARVRSSQQPSAVRELEALREELAELRKNLDTPSRPAASPVKSSSSKSR